MSKDGSHRDVQACGSAIRRGGVCDAAFVVLLLLAVARTSHALPGETASVAGGALTSDWHGGPVANREPIAPTRSLVELSGTYQAFDLPRSYWVTESADGDRLLTRDFRPRGPSALEGQSQASADAMPMLHGTSVWQRLADYRSHGRVRLLTLWETGGSSVSLQAGKKGEPSLQWTSRSMNHGGATRGLFDQLVTVSMAGANRSFHPASHPSPSEATPRPGKPAEVGMGANK